MGEGIDGGKVCAWVITLFIVPSQGYYPLSANALMGHDLDKPRCPTFGADAERDEPRRGSHRGMHVPSPRA